MTERYGTGVAGGGEDVMRSFWEQTSREEPENLARHETARCRASPPPLPAAFHDAAITVRFSRAVRRRVRPSVLLPGG